MLIYRFIYKCALNYL